MKEIINRTSEGTHSNRGSSGWESTKNIPFNQDMDIPIMPETFQSKVDAYEKECASFIDPIVEKFNKSDINEIGRIAPRLLRDTIADIEATGG